MGKKHRSETEEERKERKRAKKEVKKAKLAKEKAAAGNETPAKEVSPATTQRARPSPDSPTPQAHISSDDSTFYEKRLKMMVSLYPAALSNVLSHVREALRSLLLKYSDGVGGVLLGFDNIKFSDDKRVGMIMNELPQVHYTVELDALLFCPEVGSKVSFMVFD